MRMLGSFSFSTRADGNSEEEEAMELGAAAENERQQSDAAEMVSQRSLLALKRRNPTTAELLASKKKAKAHMAVAKSAMDMVLEADQRNLAVVESSLKRKHRLLFLEMDESGHQLPYKTLDEALAYWTRVYNAVRTEHAALDRIVVQKNQEQWQKKKIRDKGGDNNYDPLAAKKCRKCIGESRQRREGIARAVKQMRKRMPKAVLQQEAQVKARERLSKAKQKGDPLDIEMAISDAKEVAVKKKHSLVKMKYPSDTAVNEVTQYMKQAEIELQLSTSTLENGQAVLPWDHT